MSSRILNLLYTVIIGSVKEKGRKCNITLQGLHQSFILTTLQGLHQSFILTTLQGLHQSFILTTLQGLHQSFVLTTLQGLHQSFPSSLLHSRVYINPSSLLPQVIHHPCICFKFVVLKGVCERVLCAILLKII